MKKKTFVKKGLVIGAIFILLSIACLPVSSIQMQKNEIGEESSQYRVIVVQFWKPDGEVENHTITLSQQEYETLQNIINSVESDLADAETTEETITIFQDAITSLDAIGAIPDDISIEEAEQIVTGSYQQETTGLNLEYDGFQIPCYPQNQAGGADENFLCLVAGETEVTYATGFLPLILSRFLEIGGDIFFIPLLIRNLFPIQIGCIICLGGGGAFGWSDPGPAYGWLFTIGLNGIKIWNGEMEGALPLPPLGFTLFDLYPGILGFTGIHIGMGLEMYCFYLGSALWIKMDREGSGIQQGIIQTNPYSVTQNHEQTIQNIQNSQLLQHMVKTTK